MMVQCQCGKCSFSLSDSECALVEVQSGSLELVSMGTKHGGLIITCACSVCRDVQQFVIRGNGDMLTLGISRSSQRRMSRAIQ